jgi:multiple sugar transport system permease protein
MGVLPVRPTRLKARDMPGGRSGALRRHQYLFFITPAILVVLAFTAYPAIYGVFISLTNMDLAYPDWKVIGFGNYVHLFTWSALPQIAGNTVVFVGSVVVLQISLGLLIALLLNRAVFGRRIMRSIAILPWVIPAVIIGLMFQQLFNGSKLGIINTVIGYFGLPSRGWLSDPTQAMIIMILSLVWRGVPLSIILQLGGLQTISRELYEAAAIDGATRWQALRYITIPSLRPILLINLILATSGTLNHIDIPLALTGGGPGRATEVLALSIYKEGFQQLDAAYASTIATVILLINLVLTLAYLRLLRSRENDRT